MLPGSCMSASEYDNSLSSVSLSEIIRPCLIEVWVVEKLFHSRQSLSTSRWVKVMARAWVSLIMPP